MLSCFIEPPERADDLPCRYFTKFPEAPVAIPALLKLFKTLETTFETYAADFVSVTPTFVDSSAGQPKANRIVTIEVLKDHITNLGKIVNRIQAATFTPGPTRALCGLLSPSKAVVDALFRLFVPPGALRDGGPRHDNDHEDISHIQIIPSHGEQIEEQDRKSVV